MIVIIIIRHIVLLCKPDILLLKCSKKKEERKKEILIIFTSSTLFGSSYSISASEYIFTGYKGDFEKKLNQHCLEAADWVLFNGSKVMGTNTYLPGSSETVSLKETLRCLWKGSDLAQR
jgi:hypothetical protein